jgi:hypothetical protein
MAPLVPPPEFTLRYGIVALLVTAAIVGVVLWGTLGRPAPPSSGTPCGLECGVGGSLAIGTPNPEGGPGNYSYSMGITPSERLTWGQTKFAVESPTGQNLSPTSSWAILIFPASPTAQSPAAVFEFQTQTWKLGSSVLATSGQTIHLELGSTDLRGQGDHFVVDVTPSAASSASGTVSVALP